MFYIFNKICKIVYFISNHFNSLFPYSLINSHFNEYNQIIVLQKTILQGNWNQVLWYSTVRNKFLFFQLYFHAQLTWPHSQGLHFVVLISKQEAHNETEGGMLGRGCLSTVVHCFLSSQSFHSVHLSCCDWSDAITQYNNRRTEVILCIYIRQSGLISWSFRHDYFRRSVESFPVCSVSFRFLPCSFAYQDSSSH